MNGVNLTTTAVTGTANGHPIAVTPTRVPQENSPTFSQSLSIAGSEVSSLPPIEQDGNDSDDYGDSLSDVDDLKQENERLRNELRLLRAECNSFRRKAGMEPRGCRDLPRHLSKRRTSRSLSPLTDREVLLRISKETGGLHHRRGVPQLHVRPLPSRSIRNRYVRVLQVDDNSSEHQNDDDNDDDDDLEAVDDDSSNVDCHGITNDDDDDDEEGTSFWTGVADRAGWLVGLLVLQSLSSFIISRNEMLLQEHLVIVQFLTMLVGAGGNAGNQSSVRVIRGLALGTIHDGNARQFLTEELKMGATLSFILGVAGCVRAAVFFVPIPETVAITVSLCTIVWTSILLGAILPLGMKALHIDPAHSSTTIQVLMDILGVTITVCVSGFVLDSAFSNWIEGEH